MTRMLPEAKYVVPSKQFITLAFVILTSASCMAQSDAARSVPAACSTTPCAWSVDGSTSSKSGALTFPVAEESYHPITAHQRLLWFARSTVGPAHVLGVALVSAGGTAINRPYEYGPHWAGFGDRVGSGMAGSAVGNAIEGTGGLLLGEDPRYFGEPQQPFKARVGNTICLTFLARTSRGRVAPAYARFLGIVGGNSLSNSWRPRSEANAQDALLRSAEGFGGRLAANAFAEFWPDVKQRFFHKPEQVTQP